jgi:hypothetical protein
MLKLVSRSFALTCILALALNAITQCAGWHPSAEGRMACCADDACPMHKDDNVGHLAHAPMNQQDADRCCAASERPTPESSSAGHIPVSLVASPVVASVETPAVWWTAARPANERAAPTRAARHVLLSVFLV